MGLVARPTVYRGIQMRSRLEATVAANLDQLEIPWTYEAAAFGAPGMRQYLPDFRLELYDPRPDRAAGAWVAYLDVKGSLRGTEAQGGRVARRRELMARMAVIWESEPDALLVIAESDIALLESTPTRYAVWAASRTTGWSMAVLLAYERWPSHHCTTFPYRVLVPWRGSPQETVEFPMVAGWYTCEKPAFVPVELCRRSG